MSLVDKSHAEASVPVSTRVIEAVAATDGRSPTELEAPLSDVIDPDALNTLFDSSDGVSQGELTFSYCGHAVTVHADGRVQIE